MKITVYKDTNIHKRQKHKNKSRERQKKFFYVLLFKFDYVL